MVTFIMIGFGFPSGLKIKISYFFVFLWLRLHEHEQLLCAVDWAIIRSWSYSEILIKVNPVTNLAWPLSHNSVSSTVQCSANHVWLSPVPWDVVTAGQHRHCREQWSWLSWLFLCRWNVRVQTHCWTKTNEMETDVWLSECPHSTASYF